MTQNDEPNCDCPFCPLVKANLQTCDLFVKIDDDGENLSCGGISDENYTHLSHHLFILSVLARNNAKLPIGKHLDLSDKENNRYSCWVFRPYDDIFSICFHTLHGDTDPMPLNMD